MGAVKFVVVIFAFLLSHKVIQALDYPTCVAAEILLGSPKCDKTCTAIGVCSTAGWVPSLSCSAGQICTDIFGPVECSTPTSPDDTCAAFEEPEQIACASIGSFPSLVYCHTYYICNAVGGTAYARICPVGSYYSSCSGTCVTGTCTPTAGTNPCRSGATSGVDPKNNGLYYTCVGGNPQWHACASGSVYYAAENRCVPATLTNCVACASGTGAQPVPGDSSRYLWCTGPGQFEIRYCTQGFCYNHSYRGCTQC